MNTNNALIVITIAVIIGLASIIIVNQPDRVEGATWPGTEAKVATSSFQAVTAVTTELLFASSTGCAERIISTRANAITLTFADLSASHRPSGLQGHVQAASTTVNYPAEVYGCGAFYVFPFGTDTLTVTELVGK